MNNTARQQSQIEQDIDQVIEEMNAMDGSDMLAVQDGYQLLAEVLNGEHTHKTLVENLQRNYFFREIQLEGWDEHSDGLKDFDTDILPRITVGLEVVA